MADILCNNLEVIRFVNTPVTSNAFLIVCEDEKRCVVVDPGSKEQSDVRDYICENGYNLDYIILTHEHFDHCWGVNSLLSSFPEAKVVATRLCSEWVKTPMNYFNKLYFDSDEMYAVKRVDILVEDVGMELVWCNGDIIFVDAKGHSNKGICISIGNALFSGDTMIYNTKPFLKGKYGASVVDLRKTLRYIYTTFDKNTIVYPGHGESFQLEEMRQYYIDYFAKYE